MGYLVAIHSQFISAWRTLFGHDFIGSSAYRMDTRVAKALSILIVGALASCLSSAASAEPGDEVTTALPVVTPGEYNGDLSRMPAAPFNAAITRTPRHRPRLSSGAPPKVDPDSSAGSKLTRIDGPKVAMPSAAQNFEGIARNDACTGGQCGNGTPPDTNGEVGPNHYIQAVNSAYGIYNKTGTRLAAFTDNQLWSGDPTICSSQSDGDAVVIYDGLADRWILSHFAFGTDATTGNTVQPYFQCIAVSKTSDPVVGGWWLYPVRVDDAAHPWLNDYSKFGIWSDCLYMSANEFTGAGAFQGTLFASFSRANMYAGAALTSSVGYIVNAVNPFTMIPANLGGQSGAALPAGTPNYFVSESQTAFRFEVRKFTAGANCGAGGTLGAAVSVTQTSYTDPGSNIVPQPGTTTLLDSLGDRVMQKVQYRKVGAQESLWVAHTFRSSATGPTGIQWAQINVTGGTVSTTPLQQQKYDPADTLYRFMPSLAVDGQGNMALGYSTSNATAPNYPSIAYSGRLASDPANTLPQTETQLIAGGSSQTGSCGGACSRWGDYTSMSVDPADDCTFWMTNEYYPGPFDANTVAWHTRIGAFKFPACTATSRTADLAITKTDGVINVAPGGGVTYTLVVSNNGPFAVNGATVTDVLPASITGVTWSCVASAGNSCPASGSGNINTSAVNLMKGGTATFTVQGTLSPSASGPLSNTATVAVPAGFADPVPANNSATDVDNLLPPTIAKIFNPNTLVVGQSALLTITVTNPNTGFALTGITFTDALPAGVTLPNASGFGCSGTVAINANVITLTGGTLAANDHCDIPITVFGAQAQAAAWINTIAAVTSIDGGTNTAAATANVTVSKAATTISITADSANPSVVGQPYSISYAVTVTAPGSGTPTGTVTVTDGITSCTGTLPATSCALTGTSVGAKSVTATYNGSTNYSASASGTAAHQVNKANVLTAVVLASPEPSQVGQPFTVTYSATAIAPGAGTLTGTVTVSDGTTSCTGTLPATTCQLSSPSAGGKSLIATYSGDVSFNGAASAPFSHVVSKAATATTIVSHTPNPTTVGQAYTVSYSVVATAPGVGTPAGTVTVSDGSASCTGVLPATFCQLISTTGGSKLLTASYNGDANFQASTSTSASHQVNPAITTLAIVSGVPDPSVTGQSYTVTFNLTSAAAGTPSGTVAVSDGVSNCTATLPTTSCQLVSTAAGAKQLVATYATADNNFGPSVSAPVPHQVNRAATVASLTSDGPDPSVVNQPYSVSFSIGVVAPGAGTASGTVTVSDGSDSCLATLPATLCQLTSTTVGAKLLTATYNGDSNFLASVSSTASHVVVSVIEQSAVTVSLAGTGTGTVSSNDGLINCGASCAHIYPNGTLVALTAVPNAGSVFTGWLGACTGTGVCAITVNSAKSVSSTFAASPLGARILDVDNNTAYDPSTDAVLVLRYLFGLTGTALTNDAIGSGAGRFDPVQVRLYLVDIRPMLDIDGNGQVDALTDGLMIMRYLLGLQGAALTGRAVGPGALRASSLDIDAYLRGLVP